MRGIIELAKNAPCVRFVIRFLSIPLKLAIKVGVPKLRRQRHVFGNLAGHCGLPNICSWAPELWLAKRRAWRRGKARAAPSKQCSYLMETMVDARSFLLTLHNRSKVIRKLLVQVSPCVCNFVAPMQPLDCLLRPKSDEHAEYDNSNFAYKRAPAVQRFGNVEVQAVGPQRLRHRNRSA